MEEIHLAASDQHGLVVDCAPSHRMREKRLHRCWLLAAVLGLRHTKACEVLAGWLAQGKFVVASDKCNSHYG